MSPRDRRRTDAPEIKKILLIRLRRMGDILMTTPSVRGLREGFPDAVLTYVVEEPFRGLVEGNPLLNDVWVLPRHPGIRTFFDFLKKIRRERFDAVLDFHGGPRAFQMALFSGARIRIGYKLKYKGFLYTQSISRNPSRSPIHSVTNHARLVRAMGIDFRPGPLEMPSASGDEAQALDSFLEARGISKGDYIVLHISAGNKFREWGADHNIELLHLLFQRTGVRVVLVGGAEDRDAARIILEGEGRADSLVGGINLGQLHRLISNARLYIGPDSGPMHVAACTGTPIVAFFGPTLPENFSPWDAEFTIVQKDFECRPCRQRKCVHEDFRCIQTISAGEVYDASLKYLVGG